MTKDLTIMDVIDKNGIRIKGKSGKSLRGTCPFCGGDTSLSIDPQKSWFNCFRCSEKGNLFDLEIKLNNWLYSGDVKSNIVEAVKNLHEFKNSGVTTEERASCSAFIVTSSEDVERASDEHINIVYRAMLNMLTLNPNHEADLKKRGFNDKEIKYFLFKSTPENGFGIANKLMAKGLSLKGVPGFCKKNGKWCLRVAGKGYFCPAFDENRNVLGMQIRVDVPIGSNKYLWLSSSGQEDGVTSGSVCTHLIGVENKETLIITEGLLKATAVYCLLKGKVSVIGVPGVKSIKGLNSILPRLGETYCFEAYDMDNMLPIDKLCLRQSNIQEDIDFVKKTDDRMEATNKLIALVESFGIFVHSLDWDINSNSEWLGTYKGLDDFLLDYQDKDKFLMYLLSKSKKHLALQKLVS